jgi:hypothetical protein
MLPDPEAPTQFGVPLFITFSCVSVTIVRVTLIRGSVQLLMKDKSIATTPQNKYYLTFLQQYFVFEYKTKGCCARPPCQRLGHLVGSHLRPICQNRGAKSLCAFVFSFRYSCLLFAAFIFFLASCATSLLLSVLFVQLVDFDSGAVINRRWYHRTPTKIKTLDPEWTTKNSVRWKDVHLPFESLALRIRWRTTHLLIGLNSPAVIGGYLVVESQRVVCL